MMKMISCTTERSRDGRAASLSRAEQIRLAESREQRAEQIYRQSAAVRASQRLRPSVTRATDAGGQT